MRKCYICKTETVPTKIIVMNKEVNATKCPKCDSSLTTFVKPEELDRVLK